MSIDTLPAAVPAKPSQITLDTLPQLFAHHRARFGGWKMEGDNEPQRPEGISEEEWTALGDTGRTALVREREARQTAERALAAARARPAPPKKTAEPPKADGDQPPAPPEPVDQPDFAKLINDAVAAAVKPFAEKEAEREAEQAAGKIVDAVLAAAKEPFEGREFHNPANALSLVDLTTVTDGNGAPDPAKIKTALGELLTKEPHLGKVVDTRRTVPPGSPAGPGGASVPLDDRVKDTLTRMQQANGIRPGASST